MLSQGKGVPSHEPLKRNLAGITPAAKKVIYQPEAQEQDMRLVPLTGASGLICSSMRNFLAGVIHRDLNHVHVPTTDRAGREFMR